jgi:aminoglycoside/choline kinase family phosphotransferase
LDFFESLAQEVDAQPKVLMHRDFQSQNSMVQGEGEAAQIKFVDFQGARRGSIYYDLASLLWDPYVMLETETVKKLFAYWQGKTPGATWRGFLAASLQRLMQALGAYCFLSQTKKIQSFEQYIEPGEARLKEVYHLWQLL